MLSLDGSVVYKADSRAYNLHMPGRFIIGDVIRKARKERGWGQERLGGEALKFQIFGNEQKVNKSTISKIEGANPYTSELGVIWRVLAALNLSFTEVERLTGRPFRDTPVEKKRGRAG